MKPLMRFGAFLARGLILAAVFYLLFAACRLLIAGPPQRTIVIPGGLTGPVFFVEDHHHGVPLRVRGFWHREVVARVPPSGILVVESLEPFTWMTHEKIVSDDGTILGGTLPWARDPSRVRDLGYTGLGSVPPTDPLYPFRDTDGSVRYIEMMVDAVPQVDALTE